MMWAVLLVAPSPPVWRSPLSTFISFSYSLVLLTWSQWSWRLAVEDTEQTKCIYQDIPIQSRCWTVYKGTVLPLFPFCQHVINIKTYSKSAKHSFHLFQFLRKIYLFCGRSCYTKTFVKVNDKFYISTLSVWFVEAATLCQGHIFPSMRKVNHFIHVTAPQYKHLKPNVDWSDIADTVTFTSKSDVKIMVHESRTHKQWNIFYNHIIIILSSSCHTCEQSWRRHSSVALPLLLEDSNFHSSFFSSLTPSASHPRNFECLRGQKGQKFTHNVHNVIRSEPLNW